MATNMEIAFLKGRQKELRDIIQGILSMIPHPLQESHWEEWGRMTFLYHQLVMDETSLQADIFHLQKELQKE
jgi:hypothetical protein